MKRKIIAIVATLIGAILIEIPDPIPFIDEATLMLIIFRIWAWAGIDLLRFFSDKKERNHSEPIIEVD